MSIQANEKTRKGRPAQAPEDAETRKKLIRTGLAYLTEKGYSAVGINEILRDSGIPKGSFYHYFKSKSDFGKQLIEAYDHYFLAKLDRCFQDESYSPIERLRLFTFDALQGMKRYHFRRGCLVGNLSQEMGSLPEDFRNQLLLVFERWEDKTAECIRQAQKIGEISDQHDPKALAKYFWIGWEGAVLRAKLCRDATPLQSFSKTFFEMIRKEQTSQQTQEA